MQPADAEIFAGEEKAQGWNSGTEKFIMRLEHQAEGKSYALVAEYNGRPAGYVNLYFTPPGGPFKESGCPQIVDFAVLEKYRGRGIGSKLMDVAETLAKERSDVVCIGVGMHSGYGSAQRMYIKRGYIPDGSGVWYGDSVLKPYSDCCNDDKLALYLSKKL